MKHKDNGLVPDDMFMSKRLQVAAMIAQGIVTRCDPQPVQLAVASFAYADALIKQEKKDEPTR